MEAACQKVLWDQVTKHPSLPSVVFAEDYWQSGADIFDHISLANDFHNAHQLLSHWTVLDLGCGVGRQTVHLAKKAKKTFGADISESLIRLARRFKNLRHQKPIRYKVVNGRNLKNLGIECFDFVYSYQMFTTFRFEKYIVRYIEEVHKVLKPGGFAQLYIPTSGEEGTAGAITPETWERLLTELNFTQADVIDIDDPVERCCWFLWEK